MSVSKIIMKNYRLMRLPAAGHSLKILILLHKVYEPIMPLPKICLLSLKLHPYSSWVLMADGRTKGWLIWKCLFGIFNSPKKMNEKIRLYYYGTSSWIVFVRFLGELKTPKRHFEINWPLLNESISGSAFLLFD